MNAIALPETVLGGVYAYAYIAYALARPRPGFFL